VSTSVTNEYEVHEIAGCQIYIKSCIIRLFLLFLLWISPYQNVTITWLGIDMTRDSYGCVIKEIKDSARVNLILVW